MSFDSSKELLDHILFWCCWGDELSYEVSNATRTVHRAIAEDNDWSVVCEVAISNLGSGQRNKAFNVRLFVLTDCQLESDSSFFGHNLV